MSELNPLHLPKPLVSPVDENRSRKPVLESQLDLLREGIFSDATFIVGPNKERIPCHQLILKARSSVFQLMFSEQRNYYKEIPLEDEDPKIFTKLLEFIYVDNFEVTIPEALGLLQVSHKYDVQLLAEKCEELLENKVTINHAFDAFQAARKYDKIKLMKTSGDVMSKSLSKLQSLPSFSRLDKETLMFILRRNDLRIKEVDLFRLALQWAENQSGLTAQESLEDVLPLIRFPVMTLEEFTGTVVPTGLLSQSKAMELFVYFGSDAETKKSSAGQLEFSTERRKSPDSIVSVPIYSGDHRHKYTKLCYYHRLNEYLHFHIHQDPFELQRKSNDLGCDDENKTTIGLNSITVYCPARLFRFWGTASRKFKIRLLATDICDGNYRPHRNHHEYEVLLHLSPVQVKEGTETEIKFETVIPVRHRTMYCIVVQETPLYTTRVITDMEHHFVPFYAKDFGTTPDNVDVNIDNKCRAVLNIWRNEFGLSGSSRGYSQPQLILNIGFEEW